MTNETQLMVRDSFRKALEQATILEEVPEFHIQSLREINPEKLEDKIQLEKYIKQIDLCMSERQQTKQITDLMTDLVFVADKYIVFLNEVKGRNIYLNIASRRKALISELKKILLRIIEGQSGEIRDRFACRYILCNDDSEAENVKVLYSFTNHLIALLLGYNTKEIEEFIAWLKASYSVKDVERIVHTLNIPFSLCDSEAPVDTGFDNEEYPEIFVPEMSGILDGYKFGIKDYVVCPKRRGYQSLHFILHVSSSSPVCPGLFIEFQGRTMQMHAHAEDSKSLASHAAHKQQYEVLDEIFEEINQENIHIRGYKYIPATGLEMDLTGLRKAVPLAVRNVLH